MTIDSINYLNPKPKKIAIQFIYTDKIYEEIQCVKEIDFNAWLSNVGVFVGIFLGYSMMQFPELVLLMISTLKRKKNSIQKGRISLYHTVTVMTLNYIHSIKNSSPG